MREGVREVGEDVRGRENRAEKRNGVEGRGQAVSVSLGCHTDLPPWRESQCPENTPA